MITFNPFVSNFDFTGSGSGGNFSFILINEGDEQTIPENQQMLISHHLTVNGHLSVQGSLIDISARKTNKFFYDLITSSEVVEIEQNRLLEYNSHLTVHGHLRVNGRIVDTSNKKNVNLTIGKQTLGAGGNATVLTNAIFSTSNVQLTASLLPLNGKLHYDTVVDGVSFNIHTGNNSDNGLIIDWLIAN